MIDLHPAPAFAQATPKPTEPPRDLVHLFAEDFGSLDALRRELVPASAASRKPVPAYVLWRALPAA